MTTITMSQWRRDNFQSLSGRGVNSAYEVGAKARLRKEPENYYNRSDCVMAFNRGYSDMSRDLESGMIIICDCCGTEIGE